METADLGSNLKPLLGTDEAVMDGKGRILISKKKRERLGENFTMCQGDNGCLYAYPEHEWNRILREIYACDATNPGRQEYTRLVLGTAEDELGFDEQGRVVVPLKLRGKAKLEKDVVLIGCGERLEIWAKEEHEKFLEFGEKYFEERKQSIQKARREMKVG